MSTDYQLEQGLPAATDAERSILGAILLDNEAYYQAGSELTAEFFSLDAHRRIFNTVAGLVESGITADIITISEELRRTQQLEAIGGVAYLASLTDGVPPKTNVKHYCDIVIEKGFLRDLINASNLAIQQATTGERAIDVANGLEEMVLRYQAHAQKKSMVHLSEFMGPAVLRLQDMAKGDKPYGMSFGIPSVDESTGMMREEELWVIGALPNRGKTPLAMQALTTNAFTGTPGIMFSLEMSRYQVANRLLAAHSNVSANNIRRPRYIAKEEWGNLVETAEKLSQLPIWVEDASSLRLSELIARAKLAIRRQGVKLVVVDYIMLVEAPGKELRHQATAIVKAMKALAKDEHVTTVALSQFKRRDNINEKPNLTWFKESGDIEANANGCLGIHREMDTSTGEFNGNDEIIVMKARDGDPGAIPVHLNRRRIQFYDREVQQP